MARGRRATLGRLARAPVLVAAAAVQVAALGAWLGLVRDHPPRSPRALLGVAGLVAGLFLGGLLAVLAARGLRERLPVARSLALGLSEATLWVGWFAVAGLVGGVTGVLAASALLAVLLVPQRVAVANLLAGESTRATGGVRAASRAAAVQAAGAAAWLYLLAYGPAALAVVGVAAAGPSEPAALTFVAGPTVATVDAGAVVGLAVLATLTLAANVLVVRTAWR